MNKVINIDWLAIYGFWNNEKPKFLDDPLWYVIQKLPYGTRHYKDIYEVYEQTQKLYEIQLFPHSTILPYNSFILKIENKELYNPKMLARLKSFLYEFNLSCDHISRLDICADFNIFANGQHPKQFIRDILLQNTLKNRQSGYTLQGSTAQPDDVSYIRFGSRETPVCSYLYDKTKELNEVKYKKWIVDTWIANEIDKDDTWRFEISIKSEGRKLVDKESGETIELCLDDLSTRERIERIYKIYSNYYLDFRENNGTKNKSRMPKINLFNYDDTSVQPIRLTAATQGTRTDKMLMRRLQKHLDDRFNLDNFDLDSLENAQMIIAKSCGLTDWLFEKVRTASPTMNVPPINVEDIDIIPNADEWNI